MTEDRTQRQQSQRGRYERPERDDRTGRSAASERVRDQARWVDLQVQEAMRRGEFDDLPGAGKPLDLPESHDPDWWVKRLLEREQITGLAPAAIALRREDAELDALLDREPTPDAVRRTVEDFNRRIVEARRQLNGGPPVVTPTRDVEQQVTAWQQRREARRAAARTAAADAVPEDGAGASRRPSWFRRPRTR